MHHCSGTELRGTPSTCVVHHQPALCAMVQKGGKSRLTIKFCTDVHFGGAQCSFVLNKWCT